MDARYELVQVKPKRYHLKRKGNIVATLLLSGGWWQEQGDPTGERWRELKDAGETLVGRDLSRQRHKERVR